MGKDDKIPTPCNTDNTGGCNIYLSVASDWIFDEKTGEARLKRKYGKFTRPVYSMEIDLKTQRMGMNHHTPKQ